MVSELAVLLTIKSQNALMRTVEEVRRRDRYARRREAIEKTKAERPVSRASRFAARRLLAEIDLIGTLRTKIARATNPIPKSILTQEEARRYRRILDCVGRTLDRYPEATFTILGHPVDRCFTLIVDRHGDGRERFGLRGDLYSEAEL